MSRGGFAAEFWYKLRNYLNRWRVNGHKLAVKESFHPLRNYNGYLGNQRPFKRLSGEWGVAIGGVIEELLRHEASAVSW